VARAGALDRDALLPAYERLFMDAYRARATVGTHTDALQHMAGHLSRELSPGSRAELQELIDDYRRGLVPRSVPVALLRHHARELGADYLLAQTYLDPFPKQLRPAA
jgi:uncharacterized protein YbgA (DUF1722 family)